MSARRRRVGLTMSITKVLVTSRVVAESKVFYVTDRVKYNDHMRRCRALTQTTLSKGTGDRLRRLEAGPPWAPSVFLFSFSLARSQPQGYRAEHLTRDQ